jgi:hypothetical protein
MHPTTSLLISVLAAGLLALVHLGASGLRFLQAEPRSFWLSLGGGSSVAYVFLHLLPGMQQHQQALEQAADSWLDWLDRHVYLLALLGLILFYGLERLALRDRHGSASGTQRGRTGLDEPSGSAAESAPPRLEASPANETTATTFWLSMSGFTVYNALVGYLLVEQLRQGMGRLAVFTGAMALHFLVNDFGLREHHRRRYQRTGRWVLAGAVLLGMVLGLRGAFTPLVLSLLTAVLAGGVVLNVLKEELPAARNSSFGAFLLGAVGYGALLLML